MTDPKDNRVRVSAFIGPELHRRWRVKLAYDDKSMQDVIPELITKHCDGVEIHSGSATEEECDLYVGAIAWLRDQQERGDHFWDALISQWRERGQLIRTQTLPKD
jgi:hypothetical protein